MDNMDVKLPTKILLRLASPYIYKTLAEFLYPITMQNNDKALLRVFVFWEREPFLVDLKNYL